jgi:hypothetical protein
MYCMKESAADKWDHSVSEDSRAIFKKIVGTLRVYTVQDDCAQFPLPKPL